MGLSFGKQRPSSPWPDLPPELAGLILCRLLSHVDRLSFMAVCRQWRLAGQQQHPLPPALPWLYYRGDLYYQNLPRGDLGCLKAPDDLPKSSSPHYIDCFDNWILFERNDKDNRGTLFLFNPSSRKTIRLPKLSFSHYSSWARKMIVCSSGLVAANFSDRGEVAFYRPGADVSWSVYPWTSDLHGNYEDIAFHHGKLYILTTQENLLVQGLRDDNATAGASCVEHVINRRSPPVTNHDKYETATSVRYLVSSSDKLLMVKLSRIGSYRERGATNPKFVGKVFQADVVMGRWLEVKSLDRGQALFVGRGGSKAMLMPDHNNIFKWNRVYFTGLDLALCVDNKTESVPSYGFYDLSSHTIGKVFLKIRANIIMSRWFFHCT